MTQVHITITDDTDWTSVLVGDGYITIESADWAFVAVSDGAKPDINTIKGEQINNGSFYSKAGKTIWVRSDNATIIPVGA